MVAVRVTETTPSLPDVTVLDIQVSGAHAQEWWTQKDGYTFQGQFVLVMRILRKYGWTVAPPRPQTFEEFTEYGVRWHAGDFDTVQVYASDQDARDFAVMINPTGDAKAEVVQRTVTRTDWQAVDSEVPA
jgi:hypothetical protein